MPERSFSASSKCLVFFLDLALVSFVYSCFLGPQGSAERVLLQLRAGWTLCRKRVYGPAHDAGRALAGVCYTDTGGESRHTGWKVIYTFTCSVSIIPHMPGGDLLMLVPQPLVYVWPDTDAAETWSLEQ